jgi:hypothetical protein
MTVPPEKSVALYILLCIVLPGAGELYIGAPGGWSTIAVILLSFPLIFAFGLGLFLLALIWLGSIVRCAVVVWRTLRQ